LSPDPESGENYFGTSGEFYFGIDTPHPDDVEPKLSSIPAEGRRAYLIPIAGLAMLTVIIGVFPQPFVAFAEAAAAQLLDPSAYIAAVLEVR
jgi:multicomponent Na+:H+ antiporter subunit D